MVKQKILRGDITVLNPNEGTKNFALYKVCKKLKLASSGEILRQYFLCIKCNNVLNVNLSTHHNQLKRHFLRCGSSNEKMSIGSWYFMKNMGYDIINN